MNLKSKTYLVPDNFVDALVNDNVWALNAFEHEAVLNLTLSSAKLGEGHWKLPNESNRDFYIDNDLESKPEGWTEIEYVYKEEDEN